MKVLRKIFLIEDYYVLVERKIDAFINICNSKKYSLNEEWNPLV